MKRLTFPRLALCVLCGAGITVLPGLVSAGWYSQTSGTTKDLHSVQFPVDAQTGYVVGGSVTGGNVILKTTNGGTSWVPQVPPDTTLALWGVDFPVDANTGWVVGGSGLSCALFKTTDGGATWDWLDISSGILLGVDFPLDTLTGYVVGVGGTIQKTTDGGSHWNSQSSGTSRRLFSVDFPGNAMTGYAVGDTGTIRKTTDGGATWVSQTSGITKMLLSVDFPVSALTGYAVGGSIVPREASALIRTTNGGATWDTLPGGGPPFRLNAVYFPVDDQTGYAVGDSGIIVKSTNGGPNGYPQVSGTQNNLYSVHFPVDALTGYAVGAGGTILKTTDGGVGVEETGGNRQLAVGRIRILPNPFISFATVQGHKAERFSLYDVSGRKVGTYRGDRIGEGLATGVYFLRSPVNEDNLLRIVKVR